LEIAAETQQLVKNSPGHRVAKSFGSLDHSNSPQAAEVSKGSDVFDGSLLPAASLMLGNVCGSMSFTGFGGPAAFGQVNEAGHSPGLCRYPFVVELLLAATKTECVWKGGTESVIGRKACLERHLRLQA